MPDDKDLTISDNTLSLKRENVNDDSRNSNQGLILGLIALLIVVISGSMFSFYRFKLKNKKLKRHLQNVTIRYQSGSNDDEFHNPMYSYAQTIGSATYNNGSIATSYAPSSIQTTTLPHLPRNHHNLNINSLTTPRKPNQNGYLNELSLLQTDVLMKKNALADETNPNMMMKKDSTFNSNINNIYSTIDEVKKPADYKTQFENDLKNEFSDNFDNVFKTDNNLKSDDFKIPEDKDSVDFEFRQITKRNEADQNEIDNDIRHQHYDRPISSNSPPIQPKYDQVDTMKSFSKLIKETKPGQEKEVNAPNSTKPDTSHYDVLNSSNLNHYDQVKN